MSEIAKGLIGLWSLLAGWIFPAFIFVELGAITAAVVLDREPFKSFFARPLVDSQSTILFIAAVLGFLFSALQKPLYKVLEGYWWPKPLRDWGIERQRAKRERKIAEANRAVRKRTRKESLVWVNMRYSNQADEVAPSTFGNAMRRFETYAFDRYHLDSQVLHHHLSASTPESVMRAQDAARVTVDFGVCTAWSGILLTATSLSMWVGLGGRDMLLVWVALLSAAAAVAGYRIAILGTDEWAATVRAQVDLGRGKLATSLGLKMPQNIEKEREMWLHLNRFIKAPYDRPESDGFSLAGKKLDEFRIRDDETKTSDSADNKSDNPRRAGVSAIGRHNGKGRSRLPRP